MIRSIALAMMLGALGASVAAYTISPSGWQDTIASWFGGPDHRTETKITVEDWPICTTMATVTLDADWAQLDPDFKAGKKALGAEDWNGAIAAFEAAALRDPQNADIQNYIGYAYRRLRRLEPAIGHYQQALTLNPRHRGAHEHLGEAYLMLGEPANLKRAVAAYRRLATR
jgi:tetratricopeptide (TPR) repeat protein